MNDLTEQEAAEMAQYNEAFGEGAPEADNPALGVEMPDEAEQAASEEAGDTDPSAEADAGQIVSPPEDVPAPADAPEEDPVPAVAPADNKEEQRLKSWEGRLRKMEAELNAKKPAAQETAAQDIEKAGEQAASSGNSELGAAAQEVAGQVEDGTLTAAQAMKQLADDFGEDFVKLIETVVSAKASEVGKRTVADSVGQVDQKVQSIISHITDANERRHFEKIADAVPDFDDIRQTPAFASFIAAGGAAREAIAGQGEAKDVIKLLKEFKAQGEEAAKPKPKPVSQDSVDAAAGVRSGAMSLPAEPASSDDYESAWNEAAKKG